MPAWRGWSLALPVAEAEGDDDRGDDLDGAAVEEGRGVDPLADGLEGGGDQERVTAPGLHLTDATVATDHRLDLDDTLDAHCDRIARVYGIDAMDGRAELHLSADRDADDRRGLDGRGLDGRDSRRGRWRRHGGVLDHGREDGTRDASRN